MAPGARARLVTLLRARRLDSTLKVNDPAAAPPPAPTGVDPLDRRLGGGLPRGHLSQLIGSRSSGRTSILTAALAAATTRNELVALVDTLDTFDPESAAASGVELSRLLWIRGLPLSSSPGSSLGEQALRQAIKATGLVLDAGGFGLVALDLADVPAAALRRVPFVTWARLGRSLEGGRTAGVLLSTRPIARSPGGVTLALDTSTARWEMDACARFFCGFDVSCRIIGRRAASLEEEVTFRVGA